MLRKLAALELEEKILNIAVLVALLGTFLPWLEGRWLGNEARLHTGFGFYTSFIGLSIFAVNVYLLLITLIPLTNGKQLVKREHREPVRLACTGIATILTLAALSVLTRVTFDFQGMEVRFGVYLTLFGSMVATFYAFLALQERKREHVREIFHQVEEKNLTSTLEPKSAEEPSVQPAQTSLEQALTPPPPPEPEQHPLNRSM